MTQAPAACGREGAPGLLRSQGSGGIWVLGAEVQPPVPIPPTLSLCSHPRPPLVESRSRVTAYPYAESTPLISPFRTLSERVGQELATKTVERKHTQRGSGRGGGHTARPPETGLSCRAGLKVPGTQPRGQFRAPNPGCVCVCV